jgi:hypothetical protein
MLLGDGGKSKNNFYIRHCRRQREYALFKASLLEEITGKKVNVRFGVTNGFENVTVEPRLTPLIRVLVKELYRDGQKAVSREFLDKLTLQGVAIWFMDDGSRSFKRQNGKVHSMEVTLNTYLSKEENEVIIGYFIEVWGVKWGLNRSKGKWRLRMGTREGRRFFELISPFVIESMRYKISDIPRGATVPT